jgi:hypothetical protein
VAENSCPAAARAAVRVEAVARSDAAAARRLAVEQATAATAVARVSVADVNIPFGSMVTFMVKWAIASVPAVFIVGFILSAVLVSLAIILGAFGLLTTLGLR